MENSQPLATESFSYSWLTDRQPKFHQHSDENEDNFNFDVPLITSPSDHDLVHADDIFSDGQIRPVYIDISKLKALKTSTSYPSTPVSSFVTEKNSYYNLGRWRKSSKKILHKCFRFVKPLWRTSSRVDDLERKVFEVRSWGNPSVRASPRTSSASAFSAVEWSTELKKIGNHDFDIYKLKNWSSPNIIRPCHDSSNVLCDAENSIHEAILYCKRSIGL